ncbi:MAG: hypothetical protein V4640_16745 [Verrucomicrobiota bacterium]
MSQLIQFPCPACGAQLRLPLAAAARQGACPSCHEEIVAPDPERGIGAQVAISALTGVSTAPESPAVTETGAAPETATPLETGAVVDAATPEVSTAAEVPASPEIPAVAEIAGVETQVSTPPEFPPFPEPPIAPDLRDAALALPAEIRKPTSCIAACVLSAVVGLSLGVAVGYALGSRAKSESTLTLPPPQRTNPAPPVMAESVTEEIVPVPAVSEEPPAPAETGGAEVVEEVAAEAALMPEAAVEETPAPLPVEEAPTPPPAPVKASAAAEATLRAFLEAPDWASRSVHVLFPEKVRATMEAYSHQVPDGPTNFGSIAVKQSQIDEATGNTLFIFLVSTEKFPQGIPVAVKETATGWLVDWLTFIEFRDGLFPNFLAGPADQAGFFHLIASVPPANPEAAAENPNFTSYLIQSPMTGEPQTAFVKNDTPAAATLAGQTAGGRVYAPVLELVKRVTPDQREFLEILSIRADDWFPREIP